MDDDEEYSEEEIDEATRAEELVEGIIQRCEDAKFEYEDFCTHQEIGITDVQLDIYLPSGRKKREVSLLSLDDLEAFNSIEFEKYIVIGNFAAICRYDKGTIEAAFWIVDEMSSNSLFARRRLYSRLGIKNDKNDNLMPLQLKSELSGIRATISFGRMSSELQILVRPPRTIPISLTIQHPKVSTHADALRILEKLAHSLFFEIETETGLGLMLLRKHEQHRASMGSSREKVELEFPKYEYDDGPMALYWYARSAKNMPLLQFLAFYQAIEFYFSAYHNAEISRKMRAIIKDPSFRVDRNTDVAKLVNVVRPRTGSFGSEKEQLRATLHECVEEESIRDFILQNKDRADFFGSKQKGITGFTLNPKNKGMDLVNQVADRIYDIRCKVVHVKSDDAEVDLELLLPYTEEAEKLSYDIELIRMLAKKVLISSSTVLRLA